MSNSPEMREVIESANTLINDFDDEYELLSDLLDSWQRVRYAFKRGNDMDEARNVLAEENPQTLARYAALRGEGVPEDAMLAELMDLYAKTYIVNAVGRSVAVGQKIEEFNADGVLDDEKQAFTEMGFKVAELLNDHGLELSFKRGAPGDSGLMLDDRGPVLGLGELSMVAELLFPDEEFPMTEDAERVGRDALKVIVQGYDAHQKQEKGMPQHSWAPGTMTRN